MFDAPNDYGITIPDLLRYPRPPWKFGVSAAAMWEDRGNL